METAKTARAVRLAASGNKKVKNLSALNLTTAGLGFRPHTSSNPPKTCDYYRRIQSSPPHETTAMAARYRETTITPCNYFLAKLQDRSYYL